MLVEAMIFNGDNRVFHILRDLVGLDRMTALVKEVSHVMALGITDRGYPRDIARFQRVDVRFHSAGRLGDRDAGQARCGRERRGDGEASDKVDERDPSWS